MSADQPSVRLIGLAQGWRGEPLERQLDEAGLDVRRIDGVRPTDEVDGRPAVDWADQIGAWWVNRRRLTATEIGCALAHHRAQRDVLHSDDAHALVLEDDARLSISGGQLRAVLDWCGSLPAEEPSVVLLTPLGAVVDPEPVVRLGSLVVHRALVPTDGAAAYVVNRSAAAVLESCTLPLVGPSDWPPRCAGRVRFLVVSPAPVAVDPTVPSVIGERGADGWPRWSRPVRGVAAFTQLLWPIYRRYLPYRSYLTLFVTRVLVRRAVGRTWSASSVEVLLAPTWVVRGVARLDRVMSAPRERRSARR